ncbi:MAG: nicotinate (nicotinamide) nucleotide adenylyltransferase [Chlamydiia bacterium]|nr:nicotinate (nicotinamide) nucleotide adenylyltransferase [Chlamydiia bacterium]
MIGFFGGSFDPIHNGHLNLAVQLKENAGLEKVLFCPTFISPFKAEKQAAHAKHRLKMIEMAIHGAPGFELIDLEIKREGKSYTIDTIQELQKQYHQPFRLLLGEDQWAGFPQWKEAEKLISLAPPLVGRRGAGGTPFAVDIPLFDISSTEIRARVKAGQWVGHLVPEQVSEYILTQGLYLNGS